MYGAIALEAYEEAFADAPTSALADTRSNRSYKTVSSLPNHHEGLDLVTSLRTNPIFNRGEQNATERTDTSECASWLQDFFRATPAKYIANDTGVGQRAAEAIKMGRNGLSMAHLVNICRANPDFRAQFFAFCGGQLEGDPELVAQLSKAINAVMQGGRA